MHQSQFVGGGGESSTPVNVLLGVPQGSVLGPILFSLYINGVTDMVTKNYDLSMFADDNVLFCEELGIWVTILMCRKILILYITSLDSGLWILISLSASS